ncbi:c(7)-type cytochrome triheme domain-containing protein [Thalassotalea sp. G2M2-11]|uniref:c(7)-type cytochrome triheme domain-containing protein n=1 Tax=Thalassotalea sp. G2M2-11 TaxID=2787627 RepID=UPI0019D1073D|nr:c(7)-type cytochrome triheme domain-containing protein [Thalassotalea sp. G2M2-11]
MTSICKRALIFCVLILSFMSQQKSHAEYADVVLNKYSEANDMRPVIFPHWFHRVRFRCKVCHSELGFEMKVGANDINMMKIMDGQYCGMCHNGEIAWNIDRCDLCHSGKPGLKSGIRGGHKTGGPSVW